MRTNTSFSKSLTRVIVYLLFAVLVLGLLAAGVNLLNTPTGIYLVYGDENVTSDNSGITIELTYGEGEASFTIRNSEDWGIYSVQDCTVKVIPNVSDGNDFEFTVNDEVGSFSFEKDLTAGFVEDYKSYSGRGFSINEAGEFSMYLIPCTTDYLTIWMPKLLSRVYGGESVTIDEEIDVVENIYFALQFSSPDGGTVFTIPIAFTARLSSIGYYSIGYNLSEASSDATNAEALVEGGGGAFIFTSSDGYDLPGSIKVSGATLISWDSATGKAVISNVTGTVIFTITSVLTDYAVTLSSKTVEYLLSCSPLVAGSTVGYITIESTLTITLTADDDHYITDITVKGADIQNISGNTVEQINGIEYTITILNPTSDVVIDVGYSDRDL